jgi:hypothetical protein
MIHGRNLPTGSSNGGVVQDPSMRVHPYPREGLFRDVYPMVSNDILEEEKILTILRRGTYNEEERTFLKEKIQLHWALNT